MWQLVTTFSGYGAMTRNLTIAQAVFISIGLIIERLVVAGSFGVCLGAGYRVCLAEPYRHLCGYRYRNLQYSSGENGPESDLEKWIESKGMPDAAQAARSLRPLF